MNTNTTNEVRQTLENGSADSINASGRKSKKRKDWKLVIFLCISVLISAAFVMFYFLASSKFPEYQTSASARDILNFDQSSSLNETKQDTPQPANETIHDSNFFENQFSSTKSIMAQIVDLINESNSNLTSLTKEFFEMNQSQSGFNSMSSQLDSLLTKQDELADLLDYRLFELQMLVQNQVKPEIIETTASSDTKHESPPFRLISIDSWNNTWHAVLEFEGAITMIESNSERAGWLLLSIDHNAQSAKFRSQSGKEIQLTVKG